jgi:hypothetical protein
MDENLIQRGVIFANGQFQFGWSADRDNLAEVHDRDPAAEILGFIHHVSGHEDGGVEVGLEESHVIPDGFAGEGVEADGRLVEEEHFGMVKHGLGDLESPDHASGVLSDELVGEV